MMASCRERHRAGRAARRPDGEDAMEWVNGLASELRLETLSKHETDHLLTAAREVAHRVERKITPLAMYLVGLSVGRQLADRARDDALEDAIHALLLRLPAAEETEPHTDGGVPGTPG
jgi:Domain of unknown function (DUF6457)